VHPQILLGERLTHIIKIKGCTFYGSPCSHYILYTIGFCASWTNNVRA